MNDDSDSTNPAIPAVTTPPSTGTADADTGSAFDTSNRAYQRFLAIINEHFEAVNWQRESGQPVMTTLTDLPTGDTFSVWFLDSNRDSAPAIVLAAGPGDALSAHGPLPGRATAASYAPIVALSDPDVAGTATLLLNPPDRPVADAVRNTIPEDRARAATAAAFDANWAQQQAIVLLIDAGAEQMLAVGPFGDAIEALAWTHDTPRDTSSLRPLILPIRTTRAASA